MTFGSQTVTLVSIGEDTSVRDENKQPLKTRLETPIIGCRFRPLNSVEIQSMGLGERVTDPWKLTCPAVPAIVGAKTTDEITYEGVAFALVGLPRTSPDMDGTPFKSTVLVQRNLG